MGKRKDKPDKPYPNTWDIPGGKMEEGETPLDTLRRELKEETNLDIKSAKLIDVFHHTGKNIQGFPGLLLLYSIEIEGDARAKDDLVDLVWIDKKKVPQLNLCICSKYFLRDLINN